MKRFPESFLSMLKFQLAPKHTSLHQLKPQNNTVLTIFQITHVAWQVCLSTKESGNLFCQAGVGHFFFLSHENTHHTTNF